jgi:hypothetical protein
MLINSPRVAEAPSRRVTTAGSRRLADIGLGALARVSGRGDLAAEVGGMPGIRSGACKAAGYLPGLNGSFRSGPLAAGPVQRGTLQASVVMKSTVQSSTYQHNTIQVARLVPASRGGVGPHPGKEPWPA